MVLASAIKIFNSFWSHGPEAFTSGFQTQTHKMCKEYSRLKMSPTDIFKRSSTVWANGCMIDCTPPNLAAALRLEGDTSSLTIWRTCMLMWRQQQRQLEVPQGNPFLPSYLQQTPSPVWELLKKSSSNPHHDSRLLQMYLQSQGKSKSISPKPGSHPWTVL